MRVRDNTTRAGAKDPWGREVEPLAQRRADALVRSGHRAWLPWRAEAREGCRQTSRASETGRESEFSVSSAAGRQVAPDKLALKPYWGKPAVRNFREGDGDVGIMRSPIRAITPPDSRSAVAVRNRPSSLKATPGHVVG